MRERPCPKDPPRHPFIVCQHLDKKSFSVVLDKNAGRSVTPTMSFREAVVLCVRLDRCLREKG